VSKTAFILVNFGGPRDLSEVESFLTALLTDRDVIQTPLPSVIQNFIFTRVAKKRAPEVSKDYAKIGGGSPIFADTEWLAKTLAEKMDATVLTFHRYLRATHRSFLDALKTLEADKIIVFPLFPQFSYATTGSIARWFSSHVDKETVHKMEWISSYATHPSYIDAFTSVIEEFLSKQGLHDFHLFFSAHGLPVKYVEEGDPYQKECENSFVAIAERFSSFPALLGYQSQFGKAEWLKPSTIQICEKPRLFFRKERPVVFIPLSFSSDHIETLFEVEEGYIAPLRELGYPAYRCPALGRNEKWVDAVKNIIETSEPVKNHTLIRR